MQRIWDQCRRRSIRIERNAADISRDSKGLQVAWISYQVYRTAEGGEGDEPVAAKLL